MATTWDADVRYSTSRNRRHARLTYLEELNDAARAALRRAEETPRYAPALLSVLLRRKQHRLVAALLARLTNEDLWVQANAYAHYLNTKYWQHCQDRPYDAVTVYKNFCKGIERHLEAPAEASSEPREKTEG